VRLRDWLGPSGLDEFRERILFRRPFASAGTAFGAVPLLDWPAVGRVLEARPDVLVVQRGRLLDEPAPRSLADARDLFARGVGFVIRHAERADRTFAEVAREFSDDVPGAIRIQLFTTPAGTHGFGWHYDAEEVFIAQTLGRKDYFFRANTIDRDPRLGAQPDFGRIREETTPLMQCTLVAGDWLYLPRGYWHVAKCIEDSLSISIGVSAQDARAS
jgi:ribosomal protein L16 Arg81 hydroxylase